MNEKLLVICDPELRYAERLGQNITSRAEFNVKVYVYSCMEKALEFAKKKQIHILVVDEKYKYEQRQQMKAQSTFVLCGSCVQDLGEEENEVLKYRSSGEIIREIFTAYIENSNENLLRKIPGNKTKMIGIYSPLHRIGKSSFAKTLGREYAKQKKVLYLSLEEYAGNSDSDRNGWNLGDLIYFLRQGEEHLAVRLELAVKREEHLEYLPGILIPQDLKEVTQEEWEKLLSVLKRTCSYELIILDFSESVQGLMSLLEQCDRVYMPILEDVISERKLRQYEEMLEAIGLNGLSQRTYRFVMPQKVEEYAKARAKEEM